MYPALCVRLCGENREFERVERAPHVPVRDGRPVLRRVPVHRKVHIAKAAFFIFRRAEYGLFNVFLSKGVKLEQAAARNDGARHRGHRVFRRGADELDDAAFHGREDAVRLRFGPAVALVEQQEAFPPVQLEAALRLVYYLAHILHAARDRVQFIKIAARRMRDDCRERAFPAPGRTPEDTRTKLIRLDGAAEKRIFSHDMSLPQELVERAWTHSVRERGAFFQISGKQVHCFPSFIPYPAPGFPARFGRFSRGEKFHIVYYILFQPQIQRVYENFNRGKTDVPRPAFPRAATRTLSVPAKKRSNTTFYWDGDAKKLGISIENAAFPYYNDICI